MTSHRRYRRRRSSESSPSGSRSTSRCSMRASTTETDDDAPGGHQWLKRSSTSLPVRRSPASHPSRSWVLLNRAGARLDDFPAERTTSAMSRTSYGEEISVSFELVEPPGISVLTVVRPRPSTTPSKSSVSSVLTVVSPQPSTTTLRKSSRKNVVIAAHRDVVLLAITSSQENKQYPFRCSVVDFFVYQATRDDPSRRRRPPYLLLLPSASAGGPVIYPHLMGTEDMGIMSLMSCTSKDDDTPSSFVVAYLHINSPKINHVRLFRSGSGQWEAFENLYVRGAKGGSDLCWWSTDAVVPYGRRNMIWVDYYRGMVLMDLSLSHSQSSSEKNLPPPRLRYVPLPVDTVGDIEYGSRGCPKASRSVCATRYGIKFVSVDSQHWSNFGVGNRHVLKWNHRFRITTWSLREDDDYTWRKDATMHEEEFWDAFDGGDRFGFPHVQPEFPVIDVDNSDVVVFRVEKPGGYCDRDEQWMIEVDLRKKVLLAATSYSKENDGLSADAEVINSARVSRYDPIPSELPRYMDDGQACKRRRK